MLGLKKKYILFFVIFYTIWLFLLPLFVTKAIVVFANNFSQNSNYEIKLEAPKVQLSVLPIIKFNAKSITFSSKIQNLDINLQNFETTVRLLPLLSGCVNINSIKTDNLKVVANIKDDIWLDKDFFKNLKNTKIFFNSILINKFDLMLYQQNVNKPILYNGENFIFKKSNRYIKLNLISKLDIENNISKINFNLFLPKNNKIKDTIFDIDVTNVNIMPLRNYLKFYLPKDLTSIQGLINISATKDELVMNVFNGAVFMKDVAKTIILPTKTEIKSKFKIKKQSITFDSVDIKSKNINIILKGKISEYFGNSMPSLNLNVQINKSELEDIIKALPALKFEEIDLYKLKKYKFYGNVIGNININGRLPEPDITGDVYIKDGILTKPIPNTTSGAVIKLQFLGREVSFDVNVPAGFRERVWVNGNVELYNVKYSNLSIKSTENVDLHTAEVVVNPLHEILNFVIGPVPIMDIHGKGNIDMTVKGNRKNPHVWGELNFKNASVKFLDMPDLELINTDAKLIFNDTEAVFTSKNGTVNSHPFSVNGTCNLNGKFDFDVKSNNQPTEKLYKALKTTTLIPDIKNILPDLNSIKGTMDLNLKVYGSVKYIEDLVFNKNAFTGGIIDIKNNFINYQNLELKNTNGKIKLEGKNIEVDIKSLINNSLMSIFAKINGDKANAIINIPKFNPNFIIKNLEKNQQYLPYISLNAKYNGNFNKIEYENLNCDIKILESNEKSPIKFLSGNISILNNQINIKNLQGYVLNKNNSFFTNLKIQKAFSEKPIVDGSFNIKSPDISAFNPILMSNIIPNKIKNIVKNYELNYGKLDVRAKIDKNKMFLDTNTEDIKFTYIPLELPVNILNGNVRIRNNDLILTKINVLADKMPILIDGTINDIFNKRFFNIYINSKPQQEFIDKFINKNQVYPVKIKGDIVYWVRLKGSAKDYDLRANINLNKDSSIYHYGAIIGDIENSIELNLDATILNNNNIRLKDFSYNKIINSQSGKKTNLNLLKSKGNLKILKNDIELKDFYIKTSHPTDARIFNIIFGKPNIKDGQFISDLKLNGKLSNMKLLGEFHIFETNIPFFDTTMKNIELIFNEKNIAIKSKGDVMGNAVSLNAIMKNKLVPPYIIESAVINTKDFDLNRIVNKIKIAQIDNISNIESTDLFDIRNLIFNNVKLNADKIELRNLQANNVKASVSLNSKGILEVDKFRFDIADGSLNGKYKFNFNNNNMNFALNAKDINANDIANALFDLNNQIYGDLTGSIDIACSGVDFRHCMQTLSGSTMFNVKNGRMPKLGSLEYLLKAGNLLKGGITSISINSVIDIITPLKTGEFSDIYGVINIKKGIADDIEIATKGKDLSLFIGGTYDFATSDAEMEVLGMLSRKISTLFGPVGNLSINTLFNVIPGIDLAKSNTILEHINKIPGIEFSNKDFRKFVAEIKGNINGDNYVKSFRWLN